MHGAESERESGRSAFGRRSYMTALGALAATPLLSSSAAALTRNGIEFDRRVNLIEAGADPTGGELIDDVIDEEAEDGTLLVLPDGEYAIRDVNLEDMERFGIVGAEGADPRLVCQEQVFTVLSLGGGSDLLLEGFTIVQRNGNSGAVGIDSAGDFQCRNIRKDGVHYLDSGAFRFSIGDEDATGIVENCAAPDGFATNPEENDKAGIFVNRRHAGELWFYSCHIEGFQDNGLYASAPGTYGEDGPVHVRGGLWKNNNISGIRLGSTGSTVKNAVVVNDDTVEEFANTTNRRGIRMRSPQGDHVIENCDVIQKAGPADGAIVIRTPEGSGVVRNCRIRNETDAAAIRLKGDAEGWSANDLSLTGDGDLSVQIPASNVCRGEDCEEPESYDSLPDRTLRIEAVGEDVDYEVTVSGALNRGSDAEAGDDIDGSTAIGGVSGTGSDDFYFSGEISNFESSGPVAVFVDGEEVDFGSPDQPPNTIRIDAVGEGVDYEFTVSGDLQAGPDADQGERIKGSTAIGGVGGTSGDDFYFSGEVTDFQRDGPLAVFINGEEVDPDSLGTGDEDPSARTLTIEAPDGVQAEYTFEVSGDVEKSEAMGASINGNDEIDGSTVSGQVNGGTDSYSFTGDIESFSISLPLVNVYLDGEEVDPDSLGTGDEGDLLLIERAPDSSGSVQYIVETTGGLEKTDAEGASINSGDEIANGKASGNVIGGIDGYRVTDGEVTDVSTFGGDVVTTLNGETIDYT